MRHQIKVKRELIRNTKPGLDKLKLQKKNASQQVFWVSGSPKQRLAFSWYYNILLLEFLSIFVGQSLYLFEVRHSPAKDFVGIACAFPAALSRGRVLNQIKRVTNLTESLVVRKKTFFLSLPTSGPLLIKKTNSLSFCKSLLTVLCECSLESHANLFLLRWRRKQVSNFKCEKRYTLLVLAHMTRTPATKHEFWKKYTEVTTKIFLGRSASPNQGETRTDSEY